MSKRLSRRGFVSSAGATVASVLAGAALGAQPFTLPTVAQREDPSRLRTRPTAPTERIQPGTHPLKLESGRDGFLYVPPSYTPDRASPLLVLLHGAGQSASWWTSKPLEELLAPQRIVALIPESRDATWDFVRGEFGPDVRFLDRALAFAFHRCAIAPTRMGLAGFSDGASYALSLGIANGDLFPSLIAFSPGFVAPAEPHGKPRIFISHGTSDQILPIDRASRVIVPRLEARGYDVKYTEFDGRHAATTPIMKSAIEWFVA